jgi:hypothetical protein
LLFRQFGTKAWNKSLNSYQKSRTTLADDYAQKRESHRVPVKIRKEHIITLSPGLHSDLIRSIIEDFGSNFAPGGELVYVGDTGTKWRYFDNELLESLGISVNRHGKMPDVIIYLHKQNWLILVEAVASSGPVDGGRHAELAKLFKDAKAGLVFVTAFPNRGEVFRRFLAVVAWETEVWCASDPTHLIHFNGIRFLGPYSKTKKTKQSVAKSK